MADVTISNNLWKQLTDAADRHRRKPEAGLESAIGITSRALRNETRMADTVRAPFRIADTEELIRRRRQAKVGE